ncbi:MAG: hypothetical protein ACREUU_17160 [Gammaproteobacteria bacterium]
MTTDTQPRDATDRLGRIVYIVHGSERFHDQARFSILTFLDLMLKARRSDIECIVFTDRPELVPSHALVRTLPVSRDQVQAWRGPLDFVHRIKLEVMRRAIRQFGAPLIYLDTDTRWLNLADAKFLELRRPRKDPPRRATLYLHTNEGSLSPQLHPRYFSSVTSDRAVKWILETWKAQSSPPWEMWNAGAIAVPVGAEDFFEQALRLCDQLLVRLRPRTYVEQLAVSLMAARDFTVEAIEDCIHHYWGVSAEFEPVLRRFLSEVKALPTEQQAVRAGEFPWNEASLRGHQHAPVHRWKTRFAKMRNSIQKRRIDLKALLLHWVA